MSSRTEAGRPFSFFCMLKSTEEQTNRLPQVFSIAELCGRLGLSRRTITAALSSGELEHYRVGSRALIAEPAVVSWLESKRIGRRPRLRVAS
jgi:excisionase family DNA binding protein